MEGAKTTGLLRILSIYLGILVCEDGTSSWNTEWHRCIYTYIHTFESKAYEIVAKDDFLIKGFWRTVGPYSQIQSPSVIWTHSQGFI